MSRVPWIFLLMTAAALLCGPANVSAQAGAAGTALYLLAGTTSGDAPATYPVRLYAIENGRPALVRQIFGAGEGMFDAREDLDGHIYVLDYWTTRVSVIHERRPTDSDNVLFPGKLGPPGTRGNVSFDFSTWGVASGPGSCECMLFAQNIPKGWSISTILGDAGASRPRAATGTSGALFRFYDRFRYGGAAGEPAREPTPQAMVIRGQIAIINAGQTIFATLGNAPIIAPAPKVPPKWPGFFVDVLGSTDRYLIVSAKQTGGAAPTFPTSVYFEERTTRNWQVISIPSIEPASRVFGDWLATSVEEPAVGHPMESPGVDNERATGNLARPQPVPPTRLLYGLDGGFYMPGRLELDNLMDRRRITIETGQQDSQILNVDPGGNVLYRVNDKIYSAQIQGDGVGPRTLLVQGEDVPEVHWVFWSAAKPPIPPVTGSAKPPSP